MKPKYFYPLIPFILFLEIYIFSWIAELLRQPSDMAVIAGVILSCIYVAGNYFLVNYIIKQFKTKKQDEKTNSNS